MASIDQSVRVRCTRSLDAGRDALPPTEEQRARARKLLATEIAFVPTAGLPDPDAGVLEDDRDRIAPSRASAGNRLWPRELPPHLGRLVEAPLLTPERERALFHRMNHLKHQAHVLRATLNADNPRLETLEAAERLLAEAQSVRDQIVRANVRLVVSVVKRFISAKHSFDELLSDGLLTLLKCVEKFDYRRGFRFSTYTHRALVSNAWRSIASRTSKEKRCVPWSDASLDVSDERKRSPAANRNLESLHASLGPLLDCLDARERYIVCGRFAVGDQDAVRSCQSLADDLGLSKERVRQLERRALAKLHEMARRMGLDEALADAVE